MLTTKKHNVNETGIFWSSRKKLVLLLIVYVYSLLYLFFLFSSSRMLHIQFAVWIIPTPLLGLGLWCWGCGVGSGLYVLNEKVRRISIVEVIMRCSFHVSNIRRKQIAHTTWLSTFTFSFLVMRKGWNWAESVENRKQDYVPPIPFFFKRIVFLYLNILCRLVPRPIKRFMMLHIDDSVTESPISWLTNVHMPNH